MLGRATVCAVTVLAIGLSATAVVADPATDATQGATTGAGDTPHDSLLLKAPVKGAAAGGVDPHGDSLLSIQNSLLQSAHPGFVLRLFLSLSLAVGCSWLIAWHPRSTRRGAALSDHEERKALIILAVAGAIVAELGGIAPTLAFVIFGIGALLRFRTVLDHPKATGKAILVVVIGLAAGMGSWAIAVFVAAFSWGLLYWLDSHVTCNLTIRLDGNGEAKPLQDAVQAVLLSLAAGFKAARSPKAGSGCSSCFRCRPDWQRTSWRRRWGRSFPRRAMIESVSPSGSGALIWKG